MDRNAVIKLSVMGIFIVCAGLLVGMFMSFSVPFAKDTQSSEWQGPVKRYGLGRDATVVEDIPEPEMVRTAENSLLNYEYGERRNGKRVLVPGESSRKEDRLARMQDAAFAEHDYSEPEFTEDEMGSLSRGTNFTDGTIEPATKISSAPPVQVKEPIVGKIIDAKSGTNTTQASAVKSDAVKSNPVKLESQVTKNVKSALRGNNDTAKAARPPTE